MPITRAEIIEQVEQLEIVINQWESDDQPVVWHHDQLVKQISETVERHCKVLFDFVRTQDIAADARDLALAVDRFEDAFVAWLEKYLAHADVHPQGGNQVWGPYTEMLIAKTPRRRLRPEPITQLIAGNVPLPQIAKIYEWYTDDDWYERRQDRQRYAGYEPTPDLTKVSEERAKPGTHYNPRAWVSKKDAAYDRRIEQLWQQRVDRLKAAESSQSAADPVEEIAKRHCPESLEELIALPGISPEQIVKMNPVQLGDRKGDEAVDFIRQRAVEMAIPFDSRTIAMAADPTRRAIEQQQQQQERAAEEMRLAAVDSHVELTERDDRIAAMLADNAALEDIYVVLRREDPTLTVEHIHEVAASRKPKRGRRKKTAEK